MMPGVRPGPRSRRNPPRPSAAVTRSPTSNPARRAGARPDPGRCPRFQTSVPPPRGHRGRRAGVSAGTATRLQASTSAQPATASVIPTPLSAARPDSRRPNPPSIPSVENASSLRVVSHLRRARSPGPGGRPGGLMPGAFQFLQLTLLVLRQWQQDGAELRVPHPRQTPCRRPHPSRPARPAATRPPVTHPDTFKPSRHAPPISDLQHQRGRASRWSQRRISTVISSDRCDRLILRDFCGVDMSRP